MKLRKHFLAHLVFFVALASPAEAIVTYDSDAFSRFELISNGVERPFRGARQHSE